MNLLNLLPFDGALYYEPNFFEDEVAGTYLSELTDRIKWKQEPIRIMGKEIMQPRLTAWYGDPESSYAYSGITLRPTPWVEPLLRIKTQTENPSDCRFNSVLLNFYRDGNDSMGWHRDNEKSLGPDPIIGSVSLGATRRFKLRHKTEKGANLEILLTHGSFLLMKGSTQHNWYHSIPKQRNVNSPRINLTFRKILAGGQSS
jgi:alkylated DNA repair dioxygenase AlkB